MASTPAAPRSIDEIIALIHETGDIVEAEAERSNDLGYTSPEIIQAYDERGLFRLFAPRELGGDDLSPIDSLKALGTVGLYDGSTAWTAMVLNGHHKDLMVLEWDVVKDLFADRIPKIAGQMTPTGTAERVNGGYQITGHWEYGSSIHHSELVVGTCRISVNGEIQTEADGSPQLLSFFTPRENVEILGNWDTIGLVASGSNDYEVNDVFVPDEMVSFGGSRAVFKWGGTQALIEFGGWLMIDHTVIEIGLGRRVLDLIRAHLVKPTRVRGRLADQQSVRINYVQAEGRYRSALAWVWEVWEEIQEWTLAGNLITRFQASQARNALLNFNRANQQNAKFALDEGGGVSLRRGPLQRAVRDHLAASQHIHVSRRFYDDLGRDYLGEAEGLRWSPHFLVNE